MGRSIPTEQAQVSLGCALMIGPHDGGGLREALRDAGFRVVRVYDAPSAHAVQAAIELRVIVSSAAVLPTRSASLVDDLRELSPGVPIVTFGSITAPQPRSAWAPHHHHAGPLDAVGVGQIVAAAFRLTGRSEDRSR